MSSTEGKGPVQGPRRAGRGQQPPTPVTVSPTTRLDAMIRERIDALEEDRIYLRAEIVRLQARVDQLGPESSRLHEALSNAESNSTLATILIGLGGFLVSYATFTGQAAETWA